MLEQLRSKDELELGQYIPLHYHFNMLLDEDRTLAFRDAINSIVKPGMRVLELGGGTGILSWFAAQQGAQVFCVERNPALVQQAKKFLAANPSPGTVRVIQADAREYVPPYEIDVVICEMLHSALLREKQTEVIADFKSNYQRRFPNTLPQFIPNATGLMIQAVEQDYNFVGYHAPVPIFQNPMAIQPRTRELSALNSYAQVYYDADYSNDFTVDINLQIEEDGQFNALRFGTQSLLSIIDQPPSYVSWANQLLIMPQAKPIAVSRADILNIQFSYQGGGAIEDLAQSLKVNVVKVTCPEGA